MLFGVVRQRYAAAMFAQLPAMVSSRDVDLGNENYDDEDPEENWIGVI